MFTVLEGDCREKLQSLPEESVQCCITSPPYWHLRDYGCDDQLGNAPTPEEYASSLSETFAAVWRVIKSDGVLFLNLGDTFCGGGGYCPNAPSNRKGSKQSSNRGAKIGPRPIPPGYKAKDLVGFPWLVAFQLRKAGWYLRADIIWEKTNAMPEKVSDRPTRSHEYVFLFSKSAKYQYNPDAIKEGTGDGNKRNCRSVWRIPKAQSRTVHTAVFPEALVERCVLAGSREGDTVLDPFAGSGTTGVVALCLKRRFVGIEINPEYCRICTMRIKTAAETSAAV